MGRLIVIDRVFLGWTAPPLQSVASELVRRYRRADALDLRHVVVVTPGGRAGRRLLELLVDGCAREGLLFTPPTVITESALPERLYQPRKPLASPLVGRLAWMEAVRHLPPRLQQALLPHSPPADAHL